MQKLEGKWCSCCTKEETVFAAQEVVAHMLQKYYSIGGEGKMCIGSLGQVSQIVSSVLPSMGVGIVMEGRDNPILLGLAIAAMNDDMARPVQEITAIPGYGEHLVDVAIATIASNKEMKKADADFKADPNFDFRKKPT